MKPTLLPPARRDTSGDNVIGGFTAEEWHRKVIADMNRWIANNPGIPLYQGRKAR